MQQEGSVFFFELIQFVILPRLVDKFDNYKRKILIAFIMGIYFVFLLWLNYSPQKELWKKILDFLSNEYNFFSNSTWSIYNFRGIFKVLFVKDIKFT